MANVINKNKLNPVNAECLTQALSIKTAKELPYHWTFGDQGLLLDALADTIKTEADCSFQSAKSVNKWIKSVTNDALPALRKLVKDFKGNILSMDEVEEVVTYQEEKTTTIELLSTRLNLVETMNIRVPKPKSSKKAAIEDHYAAQNEMLQSVMKNLLRIYAPYAKFQAQANLKSQENLYQAQERAKAGKLLMRGKNCSSDESDYDVVSIDADTVEDATNTSKKRCLVGENSKKTRRTKKTEGPLTSASAAANPPVSYQATPNRMMTSLEKSDPGPSTQMQEQAWAVLQNPENFIDLAEYNNVQLMLKTNEATSSFLPRYLPSEMIDDIASKLKLLPRSAILSLK